jgi:hypothetical protein
MGRSIHAWRRVPRGLVVVGALALALAPTAAWARGGGWQPVQADPYDASCGATTVHVTFPVNREYYRAVTQPDGSVVVDFTGFLSEKFTTDAGASYTANISGPGTVTYYPDGSFHVHTQGHTGWTLTEEEAAELGTPQIFVSYGLLDFISNPDGSVVPIRIPNAITDVCAELGL